MSEAATFSKIQTKPSFTTEETDNLHQESSIPSDVLPKSLGEFLDVISQTPHTIDNRTGNALNRMMTAKGFKATKGVNAIVFTVKGSNVPLVFLPSKLYKGPGEYLAGFGRMLPGGGQPMGEEEDIEEAEIASEESQEREESEEEKEVVIDRADVENLMKNYEMKEEEAVELLKKHKGDLMDVMNTL